MKPAITRIGYVWDAPDGTVVVGDWSFDSSSTADCEPWTVDELREVAVQRAELALLPVVT